MSNEATVLEPGPLKSGMRSGQGIQGVELTALAEHKDQRGSFTEIFQRHWDLCINPVQWSVVKSRANVFRGMHFHLRHDEYFCLIQGHCLLGLRDIRPESPTNGAHALFELFDDDMACLSFPRGLLHGWYFTRESIHVQSVSEAYVDYGKDDNLGCHWSDPDLEIPWPMDPTSVILAERAQKFPSLKVLEEDLGYA